MNIDDILHPPAQPTAQELRAALDVIITIAETIRTLRSVPSGELYARVMGVLSLDSYNRAIDNLKRAGLVAESAHVLTWIGPTI